MAKDWLKQLQKLSGAVEKDVTDPFLSVIGTPSDSVNYAFGPRGPGIPLGATCIFYGEPGGGKSVLANGAIGRMQADYPDGICVKFNTEFREKYQLTSEMRERLYGIDNDRYICYEVNTPDEIFDRIEKDIAAQCQDGMPLKLVVIDSIMGIQGRRALNAESVMKQQIGDRALTLGDGFKRILAVQRKYNFAVILTDHVRAEMDEHEKMRGNTVKMGSSFAVKHYAEMFVFVESLKTKEGRTDAQGNELVNDQIVDLAGKAERTGFKTRVTLKKSSFGTAGRTAIFTFDYQRGFINQHEEIFELATDATGVLRKEGNSYIVTIDGSDRKWVGRSAALKALEEDPHLCAELRRQIRAKDIELHKTVGGAFV